MAQKALAIHELEDTEERIKALKPKDSTSLKDLLRYDTARMFRTLVAMVSVGEAEQNQDESDYLFQLKQQSKHLSIFSIPKNELKYYQLDFTVPHEPGLCHIRNELYLAGGWIHYKYRTNFKRVSSTGAVVALKSMPAGKSAFPLTYWKTEDSVLTVGGSNGSRLDEVTQFSQVKGEWKVLPPVLEKMSNCSATVLKDVLYCIGGIGSTNSVEWMELVSEKRRWSSIKRMEAHTDFSDHYYRDATVVSNKIVFFASEETGFVLEGAASNLEVRSKFKGIEYERGEHDSSFCTHNGKVYFFPKDNYSQVFCLDVETDHCSHYFSQ